MIIVKLELLEAVPVTGSQRVKTFKVGPPPADTIGRLPIDSIERQGGGFAISVGGRNPVELWVPDANVISAEVERSPEAKQEKKK